MRFNTAYSPGPSLPEPAMSKTRDVYKLDKVKNQVVIAEKEPYYEKIQSYAESSDLSAILNRARLGDSSALCSVAGEYVDISAVPNTIQEMHEIGQVASSVFSGLPDDLRKAFGNSQAVFATALKDGSAKSIIDIYRKTRGSKTGASDGAKPGASEGSAAE